MLNYFKKEYRQAPPGSTQLAYHQLGIVKGTPATAEPVPAGAGSGKGSGEA